MRRRLTEWGIKLLVILVLLVLIVQLYFFAQIWWWRSYNPQSTSFMRQQISELREKNPKAMLKHKWVPYNKISPHLKRAVITAEDAGFIEHTGVEWEAMQDAYLKNTKRGKLVAGGSTITQQLAKNLFLSGKRSYLRKGQEMVIAFMLETLLDKRRILEIYLNVVEWGVGVFGAEAAARHYYGVSAAALGPGQAAQLAVKLPRPRYYDRHRYSAYLDKRAARVLGQMHTVAAP